MLNFNGVPLTARTNKVKESLNIKKTAQQLKIKDIEGNLMINKELIKAIISESTIDAKMKKTVEKQNMENTSLIQQIFDANNRLQELQFRGLINSQMIEDYKYKENEVYNECEEKVNELKDQLNRKESILQSYNKKNAEAEHLLRKYSKTDSAIKDIVFNCREASNKEINISNVLNENETLKAKIKLLTQEKEELAHEEENLKKQNFELQTKLRSLCTIPT